VARRGGAPRPRRPVGAGRALRDEALRRLDARGGLGEGFAAGVRRNVVKAEGEGGIELRVVLDVGVRMAADVTREAGAALALSPGVRVAASVKATAIRVYA
jgi:molybdopterin-binding protein